MPDAPTLEPRAPRRGGRLRAAGLRALRVAVLVYVAVIGSLFFGQAWLIFPGRLSQGEASAQVAVPPGAQLVRAKTASGEDIVALFGPALELDGRPVADASSRPTVLFFYGNGDRLAYNDELFRGFRRLGANAMIAEYVGYGMSSGSPSEHGCRETAEAAFDRLASRPDIDRRRIVVAGWSLGAAVAIDLATRRPAAKLAIFSPFTSMTDMGRLSYPYVPVALLLRHRFESLAKIPEVRCPIFVAHGRADVDIPITMSERLAAAAGGPVTFVPVERAHHNDLFDVGGEPLFTALRAFVMDERGSHR
jgi:pimeloyl-ACP methyl ester carboxylesterase